MLLRQQAAAEQVAKVPILTLILQVTQDMVDKVQVVQVCKVQSMVQITIGAVVVVVAHILMQ
jgi:hypothetical protein